MLIWISFVVFILVLVAIDLGVLNRKNHVPSTREALGYTLLWATIGLSFSLVVRYIFDKGIIESDLTGGTAMLKYLTGYLVELSLSRDNVVVIALIFSYL